MITLSAHEHGARVALVLDSLPWMSAEGSRVVRSLAVALGAAATLLARETLVLGRSGEAPGSLVSATTITREDRPVLVEEMRSVHLAPYRVFDSVLAVGLRPGADAPLAGPMPFRLETGDRIWRQLDTRRTRPRPSLTGLVSPASGVPTLLGSRGTAVLLRRLLVDGSTLR